MHTKISMSVLFMIVTLAAAGCDEPDSGLDDPGPEQELAEADADGRDAHHEWEPGMLAAPTPEPAAKRLSPESGYQYYQYFTWKKGMPSVSMGPTTDKVCLLAGSSGMFGPPGSLDWLSDSILSG